jgi:hypothetical protein
MRHSENHDVVHVKAKLKCPTGTSKLYTTPTGVNNVARQKKCWTMNWMVAI